jgi:hypothetical protein
MTEERDPHEAARQNAAFVGSLIGSCREQHKGGLKTWLSLAYKYAQSAPWGQARA